jgi:2-polyprenyl-6-methoxyphenol hydroxylase-like FAD-dependent oxidoreductase
LDNVVSRAAAVQELKTVYGQMDWIVPDLLEEAASAPHLYFDAVTQIEMPRWSRDRVVLLGDACQCVSLLAGQGASMAVAAGYILAEELAKSGDRDISDALANYERRLKPSIEQKQSAGRRMADWFVPSSDLRLSLRDLGLKVALWPVVSSMVRKRFATDSVFRA